MQRRELPDGWDADIPSFDADADGVATRKASNQVLNAIASNVPWLLVGSADLTGSTSVGLDVDGGDDIRARQPGRAPATSGIREHESAAISNGLSLSKLRPVWSTYLIFSDYARPAIRLSALMELPVIHWFTHDSIGLGEDGPTHQPVEQLASLRAMPGLNVIRPCDANEVAEAWRVMMRQKHQPSALVLTRQNVPVLDRSRYASAEGLERGGYVLADCDGRPEVILIGTGSEVSLAVDAYEELSSRGRQGARRQPALLVPVRPATRRYRERSCPRTYRRGSPSSRPPPSAGTATSGRTGGSSACTPSVRRRR